MKSQGRDKADYSSGDLAGDCHKVWGTERWEFRESV
jgi:hypothetical protein